MNKITLYQSKKENHRLAFVKAMKDLTGLGLKEAKNICDDINHRYDNAQNTSLVIDVSGINGDKRSVIKEFIQSISKDCTGDYRIEDISIERESKLLDLGIGDKDDYINFMSNIIGYLDRDRIVEIFKESLFTLDESEIKILYSKLSKDFRN